MVSGRPEITPELAASVVRDFILPMFESDGKKLLRKRGKNQAGKGVTNILADSGVSGTVFQELKLSEVLSSELAGLRNKISS